MPVYQTDIWICEMCGYIASETRKTSPYSDPLVGPPGDEEWDYVVCDSKEKLTCFRCLASRYLAIIEKDAQHE